MKISDPNGTALPEVGASQRIPSLAAGVRPADSAGPSASDQIQLSSLSAYIASARSDSPAHVAKLSTVAAAVSSGGYSVDANLVSASIIQDSLRFGGANYF